MPGSRLATPPRPTSDPRLVDRYGRVATDLRVSLTDRCSLRCSYCMPADGLDWLPGPALLTDGEVTRLISVAVQRLGITEVRFTGGEPLLRRGLPGLVAATAALDPRPRRRDCGGGPPAGDLPDNQRHGAPRAGRAAAGGWAGPAERLARPPVPRDVRDAGPPGPPA